MTPEQFVAKWKGSQLGERQAAQEQFIDLCRLLEEKTPAEADATGESYCFRARRRQDGQHAAAILRKRTLTNLCNERPAWLDFAHRDLDAAVAAAYGWPADIADDEALRRLFALNQSRFAAQHRSGT